MKNTAYARIENTGREIFRLAVPWEGPQPSSAGIDGPFRTSPRSLYLKETIGEMPGDIKRLAAQDGMLLIDCVPFTARGGFTLRADGREWPGDSFTVLTQTADDFAALTEGDVVYRLYSPDASGPRPLILFLHGGGNGGPADARDNFRQLCADYGAVNFAENYPDVYVMAPQAAEKPFRRPPDMSAMSFSGTKQDQDTGWNRAYLAKICDIIRRMIREGKVDERRVYVTGMSMGGAGTIRMMSVGAGLFAACAPVCPTMMPETYDILRALDAPVWVSTAYADHTVYRHKYITDAVMQLRQNGNLDAHLTLYSPEELAKYDIAAAPGLTHEQRFSENHASWVLTYHDEHGIMSWLLTRVRR